MKKTILIFILGLLVLGGTAYGENYYVSLNNPNCDDTYNLSTANNSATPWCTMYNVILNITAGVIGDGDSILCEGNHSRTSGYILDAVDPLQLTIKSIPGETCEITSSYMKYRYNNSEWTNFSNATDTQYYTSISSSSSVFYIAPHRSNIPLFGCDNSTCFFKSSHVYNRFYWNNTMDRLYVHFEDSSINPNKIAWDVSKVSSFEVDNADNITFDGIMFTGGTKALYINDNAKNITVKNGIVLNGFDGIDVRTSSKDITIQNMTIYTNDFGRNWSWRDVKNSDQMESGGINTNGLGDNLHIYNNKIYGWFDAIDMIATNNLVTGSKQYLNSKVLYNNIFDCQDDGIDFGYYSNKFEVAYNNISYCFTSLSFSPLNSTKNISSFHHNIIVANRSQSLIAGTTLYSGEIFKIVEATPAEFLNISHNTLDGLAVFTTNDYNNSLINCTLKDNLFLTNGTRILDKSGLSSDGTLYDYNLYFRYDGGPIFRYWNNDSDSTEYNNITSAKAGINWDGVWDLHSYSGDPLVFDYVNHDYHLRASSPGCTLSSTGGAVGALPCLEYPIINSVQTLSDTNDPDGVVFGYINGSDTSRNINITCIFFVNDVNVQNKTIINATKNYNYNIMNISSGLVDFDVVYLNCSVTNGVDTYSENSHSLTLSETVIEECLQTKIIIFSAFGLLSVFAIIMAGFLIVQIVGGGDMSSIMLIVYTILGGGIAIMVGYVIISMISNIGCV